MLNFRDSGKAIVEPKTVRVRQRSTSHVDTLIQEAAVQFKHDEMTAVTGVALELGPIVDADIERTVLSGGDHDVILSVLNAPAQPTDALRRAMFQHEACVVRCD